MDRAASNLIGRIRRSLRVSFENPGKETFFAFMVHRGGSTFLHEKVFAPMARELRMECVDLGDRLYHLRPGPDYVFQPEPCGYLYSRVHTLYLPNLDARDVKKGICVLRDPRDVAISLYYSLAYSHVRMPDKTLLEHQERQTRLRQQGLRPWLKERGLRISRREFDLGRQLCLEKPEILKTTYEKMVMSWWDFFEEVSDHLRIRPYLSYDRYDHEAEFRVERENVLRHKRRVRPGNWREVFDRGLVEEAKRLYGDTLEAEGYAWD